MPPMPKGVEQGILKGMYLLAGGGRGKVRASLLGSGTILREVQEAAAVLAKDYGVHADVFSVPSFNELRREALECERWNMLNPGGPVRVPYVESCLKDRQGPFVAATDYMRAVADQIRKWVPGSYTVLGTDGYGRSDSRSALRHHFEVDRRFVVLAVLRALADEGQLPPETVTRAIEELGIDTLKISPLNS
jgi:pyruvate dehydrogenase E1 component